MAALAFILVWAGIFRRSSSAVAFTICCDNWWPWTDYRVGKPKRCLSSRQKPISGRRRGVLVCFRFLSFASGFVRLLFPSLNHIYLTRYNQAQLLYHLTPFKNREIKNVINICNMWLASITIKEGLAILSSPGGLLKITSQLVELVTAPLISKPANKENFTSQFRKSDRSFK